MDSYELGRTFGIPIFLGLMIAFGVAAMFLITMQKALRLVSPDLRKMEPGLVWLMLIPFFGFIWTFVMVIRIADSLGPEFKRRNIQIFEDRPGIGIGLAWAFFELLFLVGLMAWELQVVVTPLALIFCILYWSKIARFNKLLEKPPVQYAPQYPPQYAQPVHNPPQNYPPQYTQQPQYPPPQQPVYPSQQYPPPQYSQPQQPVYPPQNYPPPHPDEHSRWMPKNDSPPPQ